MFEQNNQMQRRVDNLLNDSFFNRPRSRLISDGWFDIDVFPKTETNLAAESPKWNDKMVMIVPDTEPKNLDIKIKNGIMTIVGRSEKETTQYGSKVKSVNQWSRELTIPSVIDENTVKVELIGDKLTITSKKKETCTVIPISFE